MPFRSLWQIFGGLRFHRRVCFGERKSHTNLARFVRPFCSSSGFHKSPILERRGGTVFMVNSFISTPRSISCQVIGVETVASGFGRTEYTEANVRFPAFWL